MFNGSRRRNVSASSRANLNRRIRSLPVELREQVLGHYLRGLHARRFSRPGRMRPRRTRYSRGAVNYSNMRVRRLGLRR